MPKPVPVADGPESYVPGNDGIIELEVGNPVMNKSTFGGHHAYPILGKDSNGDIECHRRYSHFDTFRSCLIKRYPGLYIPPIPTKVVQGKTDGMVTQERQYFLDLFLKKCCELPYLARSNEMQLFLRPAGNDIEKPLNNVAKPTTGEALQVYRACVPV